MEVKIREEGTGRAVMGFHIRLCSLTSCTISININGFLSSAYSSCLNIHRPRLSRSSSDLPSAEDQAYDIVDALSFFDARKDCRAIPAHEFGVAVHDFQRGIHIRCQVDLVEQKISTHQG